MTERNSTMLEAIRAGMDHALSSDERVVLMGEDVGQSGGIFRASTGLAQRYGTRRVIDTPLDEKGIVAHAIGMAIYGMRPIVEMQFSGFIHDAFEHIMFCAARVRWGSGGQYNCPLVIRSPSYGGIFGGLWHSQSAEAYFFHHGGIKILSPSTPEDAYRMMIAAVEDPDPVMVVEPVPLYRSMESGFDPDGVPAPIGKARVSRPGSDVTLVTYGAIVHDCLDTVNKLADEGGPDVEVIDLLSLLPFDIETILASVRKTGRLVLVHEAPVTMGFGAELAAMIQQKAFGYLKAPIDRVAAPDIPYHFSIGDEMYRPRERNIRAGIRRVTEFAF